MVRLRSMIASLLLGLYGCSGANVPPSSAPSETTSPPQSETASPAPSATSSPVWSAPALPAPTAALPVTDDPTPIDAGIYHMPRDRWAVTDYSVAIPVGWAAQYGHLFNKNADTLREFGFYGVTVDSIFSNPCVGYSPTRSVGPGVDALVTALREQPGPVFSEPVDTTLGGHPAVRVDIGTPKRWTTCPMLDDGIGLQIWFSEPAQKHLLMTLDGTTSVYVLDRPGGRQVFVTAVRGGTTKSDREELQRVLDSIRFPND